MHKMTDKYYKRVISEFLKDKDCNREQYQNVSKIYRDIETYYYNRIQEDNNFDIKIEKLRLERNFGKYVGAATNYNVTFYIAMSCPLVVLTIQESLRNFEFSYKFASVIGMSVIIFALVFKFMKESDKVNPRELMILISLKVLEDIEKELENVTITQEKEINRKELLEQIKQHIDDNNIIKNAILPAMVEIAATTVVKKNIIGKLLGKIKRK